MSNTAPSAVQERGAARDHITGELKNKLDRVWDAFWPGGTSNPLEVIEQITPGCCSPAASMRSTPARRARPAAPTSATAAGHRDDRRRGVSKALALLSR